ncbi:MAG: methyltransferase domain-containing protein [Deltaproteobacteria bacterium]|nr:methyltransferase domain-containing protein [Deltaproteobacteria bacterium]
MAKKNDVHKLVSEFYSHSLTKSHSCCGSGLAEHLASYDPDKLKLLPRDAVANSFACGDPLAFAEVRAGEVVLDLGCGAGMDLLIAAEKVGPTGRVIGVDMTEAMLAVARKNLEAAGVENVELRAGTIEHLPVEDGSVDWVISNCVINLSPDKPRVFVEIARVLKSDGRISISDMVAEGLPDWAQEDKELYGACVAGAVSEADYLDGLSRAGLEDLSVVQRLIFEGPQLELLSGGEEATGCCGTGPSALSSEQIAQLSGKIASIKIQGRKGSGGPA